MNSVTLKLNPIDLNKMKEKYQNVLIDPVPYSLFRAKLPYVTVTAYQSGKVLFQGKAAEEEALFWQKPLSGQEHSSSSFELSSLPKNIHTKNLIGSDEVGNGSYFGPLTVCAVYIPFEQAALVKELGAKDSKSLSAQQIQQIAEDLMHTVTYHLTIVNPTKYNQLIQKYNANGLKARLHNFTIQKLHDKLSSDQLKQLDGILIDQFTPEKNYYQHLTNEKEVYKENVYFAKKAESIHLSVACASIIARNAFVKSLYSLGKPYGGPLPSGAGKNVDVYAAKLIDRYGMDSLYKTAKLHFANTQKAQKLSKQFKN
ncbi:ribonuclease HIII [Facklamia miroungae]|uniref:Ribonuclease HIII n=1 Tax=Facklamia miroungae TaxID=120956 RepID=A0A1G7QYZ9_9LACT|nr:ribonuclease HIII [Facklamia miroungae]NKZ29091.1 ribonuclease HIII [Facklamia miroungae]SDG02900.1 ribonuclease HIII [Facklamia miroungae]